MPQTPVRVLVLDDYQNVAQAYGPWHKLNGKIELRVLHEHIGDNVRLLEDSDVIVVMRERTPLTREILSRLPDLKLIVSKGMRNASIDLTAARESGVMVCGTQGAGVATGDLAWGLILALARNICIEDRDVRAGGWQTTVGIELAGRTLGVVGLGKLGSRVAKIGQAFDLNVIAWSQNLDPDYAASISVTAVSKQELLSTSDVISLHLQLSERTRGVIGAEDFKQMKPTAYIINTSRGPLIDQAALVEALRSGQIAGAGLDVYDPEPLPRDHPLRSLPNTVLTPHIGYVTEEGYRPHFEQTVEDIAAWLDGAPIRVMAEPQAPASEPTEKEAL